MVGFYRDLVKRFFRIGVSLMMGAILLLSFPSPSTHAEPLFPHVRTFKISAYYSPCQGQSRYATGTYEGDIRLNGNGTNGADGTPVYAGMIAAPKTYPFGTKMSIPGVGITAVHDRGGAIVPAGERDQDYDRLDLWMGWCEEGLTRALTWGVRVVDVTVYGVDDSIQEDVYLEGFSVIEQVVKNVILAPQLFPEDVWYLSSGEDVERLQVYLTELGFYSSEITGVYGTEMREAVYQFQLANGLVSSWEDLGAGHTGVNTRKMLDLAISRLREEQEAQALQRYQQGLLLLAYHPDLDRNRNPLTHDLSLGSVGEDVRRLQQELRVLGYLRLDPTGYYGEVTQHAVFKFQQKKGIVLTEEDSGAGVAGPQTRSILNTLIEFRTQELSLIAYQREQTQLATNPPNVIPSIDVNDFTRTMVLGDRGSDVKALQALLRQLGFFEGAFVTEFYGEQTQAAVLAFQKTNGLVNSEEETHAGQVDETTLARLNELT